jgi:hypothetical protein
LVLARLQQPITEDNEAAGQSEQAGERDEKDDVHQGYSRIEVNRTLGAQA